VRVVNPIASTHAAMRSTLIGSLVEVLRVNLARKLPRVRAFELGKVFVRDGQRAGRSGSPSSAAEAGALAHGPAACAVGIGEGRSISTSRAI
jgi:phenylalanyl-tRNA synthetase beta chain